MRCEILGSVCMLTDPSAVEQEGLVGLVVQLVQQIVTFIKAWKCVLNIVFLLWCVMVR